MTTILHICGAGRSGSTLLELILANHPEAIALGGTRMLWQLGFDENVLLPEGHRFLDDPLWRKVAENISQEEAAQLAQQINRQIRMKQLPLLLLQAASGKFGKDLDRLRNELSDLFQRISTYSGKRFIIDSTSSAPYSLLLNSLPNVEVVNVHLIRHPRAVSYSWQRPKAQPEHGNQRQMVSRSQMKSDIDWSLNNFSLALAIRLGITKKGFIISYEQLCKQPETIFTNLNEQLGDKSFDALDVNALEYVPTKGVAGNPIRFKQGPLDIRSDERWKNDYTPGPADWIYRLMTR